MQKDGWTSVGPLNARCAAQVLVAMPNEPVSIVEVKFVSPEAEKVGALHAVAKVGAVGAVLTRTRPCERAKNEMGVEEKQEELKV